VLVKCVGYFNINEEEQVQILPGPLPSFAKKAYCVNVASYENGIGYGKWTHIDGWSDSVIDFIAQYEKFLADTGMEF